MKNNSITPCKKRVAQRFSKASQSYSNEAIIQKRIASNLTQMLPERWKKQLTEVLEVGCGSGFLTQELHERLHVCHWTLNDIVPGWESQLSVIMDGEDWSYCVEDAENITFKQSFDLIASSSTIQWFESPDQFVRRAYDALTPGGILLLSTFGVENFKEIRAIVGKGLNYLSPQELCQQLPKEALSTVKEELIPLSFLSPTELLRHLKSTGVTATNDSLWSPAQLRNFTEEYTRRFSKENKVWLTYHPLYLVIQKPN